MSKDTFEVKHVRGVILTVLKEYYPNGLRGSSIFSNVVHGTFPALPMAAVVQQIAYLAERGYLEQVGQSEIVSVETLADAMYRVTPAGFDVATGVVSDPAIQVEG